MSGGPAIAPLELAASVVGHVVLAGVLLVAETCVGDEAPLIDPNEVIVATAVAALPRSAGLPQKAMRTADPPKGAPKAEAPPPPPTASDMVLKKEDAPEKKGEETPQPKDRSKEREELLRKQQREALLRDMTAEVGPRDQMATDPNGVDPKDAVIGAAGGAAGDPALAKYIGELRNAVIPNWTPLPSTVESKPHLKVVVQVRISGSGTLSEPQIVTSSGDPSFDRTATLALVKTRTVPPPPAEWRASAEKGVQFILYAKDKQ